MLIFKRALGQSVVIGTGPDSVIVTVVKTGREVKLGFSAPPSVPIDRAEVRERIIEQGVRRRDGRDMGAE